MIASQGTGNIHTYKFRINLEARITWLSNVERVAETVMAVVPPLSYRIMCSSESKYHRSWTPKFYYYKSIKHNDTVTLTRLAPIAQLLC